MPASNRPACAICGEDLVYKQEATEFTCHICGKTEIGHTSCVNGHYVCDMCHRQAGVNMGLEHCLNSTSTNPIEIMQEMMADKSVYPNGPEHHSLVGFALLAAFANAGGEIDKAALLEELRNRSMKVPGGTCGYWGTCGAAISAGQFWSIISKATPLTPDAWTQCQRLTSRILGKLADIGGPRCCKRTSFVSILEAAAFCKEQLDVQMDLPDEIKCAHFPRNKQCLKNKCPFYPAK